MKRLIQTVPAIIALSLLLLALPTQAQITLGLSSPSQANTVVVGSVSAQVDTNVRATLSGLQEVPAVSTQGSGDFTATINGDTITFELSYALEGDVAQAHIHFGQTGVNGGISVFLCTNLPNAPEGTVVPSCPASPATVVGSITPSNRVAAEIISSASVTGELFAADVIGPAGQGIPPGEIEELIDAILAGSAYVNVHSQNADGILENFNAGEVRGQIELADDSADTAPLRITCENGSGRSRISVDARGFAPSSVHTIRVSSGGNTSGATVAADFVGGLAADFDSSNQLNDTLIIPNFIQGNSVTASIDNGPSITSSCEVG